MRSSVILALLMSTGCSFVGARRPDPPPYSRRPDCADGYGRPIADTAIGAGGLLLAGVGVANAINPSPQPDGTISYAPAAAALLTGGVVAGIFVASAIFGYPRVASCKEVTTEWDEGTANRERLADEAARAAAESARAARRQAIEGAAATLLRCPTEKTMFVDLTPFDERDPLRPRWGWAGIEATGCGLAAWCGDLPSRGPGCVYPNDFYTAAAQLALETQCAESSIDPVMQQVFARRTWSAERGESLQITWRLNACGNAYVCSVTSGLAATVSCKAALASQPQ